MLIPTLNGRPLTPAQRKAFDRGISKTHWREVEYVITDLNHRKVGRAAVVALEGGVHGNRRESPSRTLDVTLWDPSGRLPLEPDEAAGVAVHRKRMIQVTDCRHIEEPGLYGWVETIVFTGPVVDVDRDGPELKVLAGDKSRLAQGDTWTELEYPRKTRVSAVARGLLEAAGERRIAVAPSEAKLAKRLTIPRFTRIWPRLRKLARGRDRVADFSPSGWFRMRRIPNRVQWTVPKAMVCSEVSLDREDTSDEPNVWRVLGAKPEGEQQRIRSAFYYLPAWHQDSAFALARTVGGKRVPFRRLETDENEQIKSPKVANARARRLRNDALRRGQTLSVETGPFPHGELGDLIRVPAPSGMSVIRMDEFFLPLAPGQRMTIGVDRKLRGGGSRGGKQFTTGTFPRGSSGTGSGGASSGPARFTTGTFPRGGSR